MGSCCTSQASNIVIRSNNPVMQRMGNFSFYLHSKFHIAALKSGEGCKQTPSWETELSAEAVSKKREEFWETRVEGNSEVWQILQNAVQEDHKQAEAIVKAAGLKMPGGYLMQVYDSLGQRYTLPPFIINEPLKYGAEKQVNAIKEPPKEISFVVRSTKSGDTHIKVSNHTEVSKLKENYQLTGTRLFFNGKELKDNSCVGHYAVTDGVVVQAF